MSGGFTLPADISCAPTYITTKAIDDPGREMLNLLLRNQGIPRFVNGPNLRAQSYTEADVNALC